MVAIARMMTTARRATTTMTAKTTLVRLLKLRLDWAGQLGASLVFYYNYSFWSSLLVFCPYHKGLTLVNTLDACSSS
jgi:hypothetical protein